MTIMYHDGNRRLQDQFDSRRISDRLEEKLTRTAFTADDKAFIESAIYFFLSSADAEGRPDCSFKGGPPGFVRVTGPSELVFPDEIHGFLRHASWLKAYQATAAFLDGKLTRGAAP